MTIYIYICICHWLPPDRTRHKVNDPKVDYSVDLGKGRSGTSRGSSPAGLCWSSTHFVQYGLDEPSWSWTQIWVQARMPDYSLKLDSKVQCYTRGSKVSMLQLAHPKVAQPKLRAFQPRICHWFRYPVEQECQTARLKPGKYFNVVTPLVTVEREQASFFS